MPYILMSQRCSLFCVVTAGKWENLSLARKLGQHRGWTSAYIIHSQNCCLDTALFLWCWAPHLVLRMLDGHYATGLEVQLASVSLPHGGSSLAALLGQVLEQREKLFGAVFCPSSLLPFLLVRGSRTQQPLLSSLRSL